MKTELNTTYGNSDLCGWQQAPMLCVIQTRESKHAARLSKRQDCRLIGYGVVGEYLKLFLFEGKTFAWVKRLVDRYTFEQTSAGTRIIRDV